MKKLLAVVLISTFFTGCAQIGQTLSDNLRRNMMSSIDVAKEDCLEMGFKQESTQYQNCILTTTHNIRNARTQQAAADSAGHQAFMNNLGQQTQSRQPVQQGYRTYDCRARLGGRVECTGN